MSRMVWMAVGAAGGVIAYKKVTRVVNDAKQRTLVGNVNAAATAATVLVGNVRQIVSSATPEGKTSGPSSASRVGQWIPPRSDVDSLTSSPNGDTPPSPARH